MPLFDYHCENCNATFEVLRKTAQEERCPNCSSMQTKKLLTPSTIIYKGTGFYTTDYTAKKE